MKIIKKKVNVKIILIVICFVLVTISIGLQIYSNVNEETIKITEVNQISTFIEEYESYNGEELYEHDILDLDLNEDAIVYIKTAEEIVEIMQSEDALIYFGFPTCPWCRNMLEALVDAAAEKDEPIYYVNIKEVRNTYVVEDGLIVESVAGEDAYYDILEIFGSYLSDYVVYDEDGNEYNTNTTRLYAPTIITVQGGELLDIKIGTLDEITDPYTKLTDEQYIELNSEFENMINDLQNPVCGLESC